MLEGPSGRDDHYKVVSEQVQHSNLGSHIRGCVRPEREVDMDMDLDITVDMDIDIDTNMDMNMDLDLDMNLNIALKGSGCDESLVLYRRL